MGTEARRPRSHGEVPSGGRDPRVTLGATVSDPTGMVTRTCPSAVAAAGPTRSHLVLTAALENAV